MVPLLSGCHHSQMSFVIINLELICSQEVSHDGVLLTELLRELLRVLASNGKSAIICITA